MPEKTQFPSILYHGTYYNFDYFRPLTHFGSRMNAETNLREGKWKRDPNIDITKPKIIPVTLRNGHYNEIPDLNDHSVQNYMGILFLYTCSAQVTGFSAALDAKNRSEFERLYNDEYTRLKNTDIIVPWEFDWVCEPIVGKISDDEIRDELACDTLFENSGADQLFFQRMILYFESIGINGFKYKNYTEGPGDYSYIIFRQNGIKRLDKNLPTYPMPLSDARDKIQRKQSVFSASHSGRKLTDDEKEKLFREIYQFGEFKFQEIETMSNKSWAKNIDNYGR